MPHYKWKEKAKLEDIIIKFRELLHRARDIDRVKHSHRPNHGCERSSIRCRIGSRSCWILMERRLRDERLLIRVEWWRGILRKLMCKTATQIFQFVKISLILTLLMIDSRSQPFDVMVDDRIPRMNLLEKRLNGHVHAVHSRHQIVQRCRTGVSQVIHKATSGIGRNLDPWPTPIVLDRFIFSLITCVLAMHPNPCLISNNL